VERTICVYCSSSDNISPDFFGAARELGTRMAQRGYALVYGGSSVGLMGAVARSVHEHGGRVIGVIPESLYSHGVGYDRADELIITKDMRERKAMMESRAEAFVALPGGFGTLEEVFEILTLKQLRYHNKPLALLNAGGFYDPLLALCEHMYEQKFAKPEHRQLYHVTPDVDGLFTYLDSYQPPDVGLKWTGSQG
jgi:cytokinin riboside 5'-monophosphate phosphoribohydrolase